jgi:hypothetical protein
VAVKLKKLTLLGAILLLNLQNSAWASDAKAAFAPNESPEDSHSHGGESFDGKPGVFLTPILSFFLPGLGQYIHGETAKGLAYTAGAGIGLLYAVDHMKIATSHMSRVEIKTELEKGIASKNTHVRSVNYGAQIYQAAGGLSAYDSFRFSTQLLKKMGEYTFLGPQDDVPEILCAPFHFQYLVRPSSFIPLALGAALAAKAAFMDSTNVALTSEDYVYSGLYSYSAGTHEEAIFRGYLLPLAREYTGSDLWSNAIASSLFALAHMSTVSVPLPQLMMGFYLGQVTQWNHWSISESVFIHSWWDVFAFLSLYLEPAEDATTGALAKRPPIMLPPLALAF